MLKNNSNNNNTVQTVSYSSHPSFFVCFSGVGSHWQQAQKVILEALLPSNTSQLLLGNPETFPGQMRYIIPPVSSGSAPGSPPSWSCQENIQREAPRRHPNQLPRTTSAGSFQLKEAAAPLWAPSRCPSSSSYLRGWATLIRGLIFSWSLPKACDHGWVLECRSSDKQKASPSSRRPAEPPMFHHFHHSVSLTLTCEQDPKILELNHLLSNGNGSPV